MVKMLSLYLAAKATHIRWLHPGYTDRIFLAVTSTKQYDQDTRTGKISIYRGSKIKERIFVGEKKTVENM